MGSLFINAGIVAGVSLAALPVILHLFMKQTPKHIIFPALRLIKERQKRSRKKLRVKNWLLLLARMCLLALMALALARPRIDVKANIGTGEEPTALAFVFDTSLSMSYKERDRTRLDEAKERAAEVLKKMNDQSRVFIVDGSDPAQPIAQSPAAARKKLDGLTIHSTNRPLNTAVGAAYTAVGGVELPRREVYILTDMAASQWQVGQEVEGLAEAKKAIKGGGLDTFVLRVGAKDVRDVAIVSAETASPVATEDDPVILKVKVRNIGPKARRIVELYVDDQIRDQRQVDLAEGAELDVPAMKTPKLSTGLHRIEVRLAGEPDPLKFDDGRFLTIDVRPPLRMLVVSDLIIDGAFVSNALDPQEKMEGEPQPFQVDRVLTADLDARMANRRLSDYSGVFLLNVKSLSPSWWTKLFTYVREGGGLVVAPAGRADVENYNTGVADQFLPGQLGRVRDHAGGDLVFGFGKADLGSPIFARNQKELLAALAEVPIFKTREITPEKTARVLLRYTDESPALIEGISAGQRPGKVLLWSTALSRRPEVNSAEAWNDFPIAGSGWPFVPVMDQTAYYLAGAGSEKLVFEAGEDAALPLDPSRSYTAYSVLGPNAKAGERRADPVSGGTLMVSSPDEIGQWSVKAKAKEGPDGLLGFSVNPPRAEMQATRLDPRDLDVLFGKGKYQLAEDAAGLTHAMGVTRRGHEIFPWIMAAILLLVTLENLLANTFYREKVPQVATPGTPSRASA
jgi:hypothetical protein